MTYVLPPNPTETELVPSPPIARPFLSSSFGEQLVLSSRVCSSSSFLSASSKNLCLSKKSLKASSCGAIGDSKPAIRVLMPMIVDCNLKHDSSDDFHQRSTDESPDRQVAPGSVLT